MRGSLTFFWRIHLFVMLGVAVATAVLTGALLVGDSVRDSLRDLTLDRLAKSNTRLFRDVSFARVSHGISRRRGMDRRLCRR